ncbi:glycoside hydrolase family 13 protein [Haliovirga abyssi]|uniref:Neopullulanase n=1 Tax=Haliovirga abyssi TaxID=2996794 RepID=A0AAU9D8M6_9FUSO|nr:glycoside hydrolase family 13 protein [Haliovirga abyssi]BDU49941.1 neopullulanase [Haliovirga abyssi]
MNKTAIFHEIDSNYCYGVSKDELLIKIRTEKNNIKEVELLYVDKFKYLFAKKKEFRNVKMKKRYTDDMFDYYETVIKFDVLSLSYIFKLKDEKEEIFYGNYKFYNEINKEEGIAYIPEMFTMPVLDFTDLFITPKWAEESIVYQIFPERFYRGDNYIENKNHLDWNGNVENDSYLGGNLLGIIDKMEYISELGVNTIYLNPIFKAGYNHKYCTFDYFEIDPDFGTLELFKKLVKKAHKKGIKIILDGAFSSTGVEFEPFTDILEKNEKSKYSSWYKIDRYPVEVKSPANYKCFAHFPLLPKLNYSSLEMQEYILKVLKYWIEEADIDGWRLDVADEIPHSFWKKARKVIKEVKSEAIIIGEVWYDSSSWLNGDEFDTVMNYQFYTATLDYIAKNKINSKEYGEAISKYLAKYKKQTHKLLWNLIGTHDTARFSFLANERKDKKILALILQFTMIGTPLIYYGDEVGLTGGEDPDNRRGMLWGDSQDKELLEFYKKIIKIRKNEKALFLGEIEIEDSEDNVFHFRRKYNNDVIEIYINNSDKNINKIIEGKYIDIFDEKEVLGEIDILKFGFKILKK